MSVKLPIFNQDFTSSSFKEFKRAFNLLLLASELDQKANKVKVAYLQSGLSSDLNNLVERLPVTENTTVDQVFKFIEDQLTPHYQFFNGQQQVNESLSFILRMKKLSKECKFGDQEKNPQISVNSRTIKLTTEGKLVSYS